MNWLSSTATDGCSDVVFGLLGRKDWGEALLEEGGRNVLLRGCGDGGAFPSYKHQVENHAKKEQAVP